MFPRIMSRQQPFSSEKKEQPFFGPGAAQETQPAFFQPALQRSEAPVKKEEERLQRQETANSAPEPGPALEGRLSKGGGEPLPFRQQEYMGQAMGADFSPVRIHRNAEAADMSRQLQAKAFTHGNDVYFSEGAYNTGTREGQHLLAHELTHVVQQTGAGHIARVPAAPTPLARGNRLAVLGDGTVANPGMTLEEFDRYMRQQADWFAAPTLTAADRTALWQLVDHLNEGPHILAGLGDLRLTDLIAVAAPDWPKLSTFGHGCHQDDTVIILARTTYTLPQRINMGSVMQTLESIIGGVVIKETVAEAQLVDLSLNIPLLTRIALYWAVFHPHLEQAYTAAAGARDIEFQHIMDLMTDPAGIGPFILLWGNVRNLHRFSRALLLKLVHNFSDFSRSHPVQLILHTGHDAGAFQPSAHLFEDLVVNSPNLVLMLEGANSLADLTARVPAIANAYGQPDGTGHNRLSQVMIAGHGSARSVQMAGTGAPIPGQGHISYPSESLNIDSNLAATQALLDVLLRNMDPARARIIYAGCLVGANAVPAGTPAANIAPYIASHPSLGTFTQQRGAALGVPVQVEAARASVGLSAASSFRDPANNLHINYSFDPDAFGGAAAYIATGHEPEGMMRAAVEDAAVNPVVAANHLRARLGFGVVSDPWWDQCTIAMINTALIGVPVGGPVNIERLNQLADMAEIPFLGGFGTDYHISVAHYVVSVNNEPPAADLYGQISATSLMVAPPNVPKQIGRFMMEQGWLNLGGLRAAPLIAFLTATPTLTVPHIRVHLDPVNIAAASPLLFPAGAPLDAGRIRLALAWLMRDPANLDVKHYLDAQVTNTLAGPALSAPVAAELTTSGITLNEVLNALGRLVPTRPVREGGVTVNRPLANAEIPGRRRNTVRIEPQAYRATVVPGRNWPVYRGPGPAHMNIGVVHPGDVLQVAGFTGNWAAIDFNGRLGFVHHTHITP